MVHGVLSGSFRAQDKRHIETHLLEFRRYQPRPQAGGCMPSFGGHSDGSTGSRFSSLDHLIRSHQQRRRDSEAKGPRYSVMPVARKLWQPILVAMPASRARRRIMR